MICSAIRPWPTPSSIASSTTPIGSNSGANPSEKRRRGRTTWLDRPVTPMETSALPTDDAAPADIDRNGRPTSIGTGGRHHVGINGRLRRNAQSRSHPLNRNARTGIGQWLGQLVLYQLTNPLTQRVWVSVSEFDSIPPAACTRQGRLRWVQRLTLHGWITLRRSCVVWQRRATMRRRSVDCWRLR